MDKVYEAQPGRQEWVTVIECISGTGERIPPYVIFKGQNLMTSWFPKELPKGESSLLMLPDGQTIFIA